MAEPSLVGDYKRLKVWARAHNLTCAVYTATRHFPQTEQFGLGAQLRRAAVSIGANIAERSGRNGDGELWRFLNIALGSAKELRHLLELVDVGLMPRAAADPLIAATDEVRRMLAALAAATKQSRQAKEKGTAQGRPNQGSDS